MGNVFMIVIRRQQRAVLVAEYIQRKDNRLWNSLFRIFFLRT